LHALPHDPKYSAYEANRTICRQQLGVDMPLQHAPGAKFGPQYGQAMAVKLIRALLGGRAAGDQIICDESWPRSAPSCGGGAAGRLVSIGTILDTLGSALPRDDPEAAGRSVRGTTTGLTTNVGKATSMAESRLPHHRYQPEMRALAARLRPRSESVLLRDQPEQQSDLKAAAQAIERLVDLKADIRWAADNTTDAVIRDYLQQREGR
jgi:hypothetical protein